MEDPCADDDPPYPVETRHVLLGLTPIEEYRKADCPTPTPDINWELAREFLWGDRFPEPLAMVDWTDAGDVAAGSPERLYFLRDVLGSAVGLAKPEDQQSSGTQSQLVERYVYDPYGQTIIESWDAGTSQWVRVDQSAYGNPWMWTGQRYDAGVGLYHFVFRSYSPELGRWLQRDSLGYVDGVSLYEYVRSGVMKLNDPLGLDVETDTIRHSDGTVQHHYYDSDTGHYLGSSERYRPDNGTIGNPFAATDEQIAETEGRIHEFREFANTLGTAGSNLLNGALIVGAVAIPDPTDIAIAAALGVAIRGGRLIRGTVELTDAESALLRTQIGNIKRFMKKNPKAFCWAAPLEGGSVMVTCIKPGRIPGSKAYYEKIIGPDGVTKSVKKTTYGPNGELIHEKDKFCGGADEFE